MSNLDYWLKLSNIPKVENGQEFTYSDYRKAEISKLGSKMPITFLEAMMYVTIFAIFMLLIVTFTSISFSPEVTNIICIIVVALPFGSAFTFIAYKFIYREVFFYNAKLKGFKAKVWVLLYEDVLTHDKTWRKVKRNLNKKELETFTVLLETFDGNVQDLILVSKELELN